MMPRHEFTPGGSLPALKAEITGVAVAESGAIALTLGLVDGLPMPSFLLHPKAFDQMVEAVRRMRGQIAAFDANAN